jgi:hypothetical protein
MCSERLPNVVLADPSPRLGGMCSGGLGSSDIGDPVVIGGLAHEFFVRVARTYNATTDAPEYYLEPHVAEAVFYDMLKQANVTIVKHGNVVSVARTIAGPGGPRITSVTMESGATLGSASTVYIDGTYEGDLMARAGVSFTWGREANTTCVAPTCVCSCLCNTSGLGASMFVCCAPFLHKPNQMKKKRCLQLVACTASATTLYTKLTLFFPVTLTNPRMRDQV